MQEGSLERHNWKRRNIDQAAMFADKGVGPVGSLQVERSPAVFLVQRLKCIWTRQFVLSCCSAPQANDIPVEVWMWRCQQF